MSPKVNDWVVWSYEHDAWWGGNGRGYPARLMWAGLYSEKAAKEIADGANRLCPPNRHKEKAMHITDAVKVEMERNPCPWGQKVGDVMIFPTSQRDAYREPCDRCAGCGEIADDEDGTPWKYWVELPDGANLAARMGIVKAIPCPECKGAKFKPTSK